jgi:hypothetical protein
VPDKKISELPDGAPPQDIDEYVIARAGSNFSLSYGAMTSGGVSSLSGVGAVTVATNGSTISIGAPAQSVQTQNVHNVTLSGNTAGVMAQVSSGTLTLAGGNNITVSQNGNAVTISGANVGGAQTGISGIANSQTTYTSGTVSLSELGAITIRSTTGNQFQFSVNPQSTQVETQTFVAGIIASDTTYTSGNVRFTGVGGGITVSSNTGQRVDLSVAAPVAQTNQAGSVYAISNTSGTSSGTYDARTLSIAGAGMITVAASNSGWRINATQSVQPETQTAISGIANSQTTYTSGTVSLSELGAITIRSTTGNQYQLSVNAQTNQAGSVYAISNTSGTSSGTYDARTLSIAGAGMITVAASNSGWRINADRHLGDSELPDHIHIRDGLALGAWGDHHPLDHGQPVPAFGQRSDHPNPGDSLNRCLHWWEHPREHHGQHGFPVCDRRDERDHGFPGDGGGSHDRYAERRYAERADAGNPERRTLERGEHRRRYRDQLRYANGAGRREQHHALGLERRERHHDHHLRAEHRCSNKPGWLGLRDFQYLGHEFWHL